MDKTIIDFIVLLVFDTKILVGRVESDGMESYLLDKPHKINFKEGDKCKVVFQTDIKTNKMSPSKVYKEF